MKYFDSDYQNNFQADFGFNSPHRTRTKCSNPVFADPYLHRIALMKDTHYGSKGDPDENGLPGWTTKNICTGCGKSFTVRRVKSWFVVDKK